MSTVRYLFLAATISTSASLPAQSVHFVRGDSNIDGALDMSDAIYCLSFLFAGGTATSCDDAADVNDDGAIDISDGISLLSWLFLGSAEPPSPSGACGHDPTEDALRCIEYPSCHQPVVYFDVVDGMAVIEGDIVLGYPEEIPVVPGKGGGEDGTGGGVAVGTNPTEGFEINGFRLGVRWPDAIIPYRFDDRDGKRVSDATGLDIMQGIWHWQHRTRFRFVQRTHEEDYVTFRTSNDTGCGNSRVGRTGGEQIIKIKDGCGVGTVIHELGHCVGLWHEQSREDRNDFIEVLWDNISRWEWPNFQRREGLLLGNYDLDSIMHYPGQTGFERPGCGTCLSIRTLDPANQNRIGQRTRLSNGDLAGVEALYGPPRGLYWSAWSRLGPADGRGSQIAVGSNADGRLEVFVRGVPGDNLWHIWQTTPNANWHTEWSSLGGVLADRPFVMRTPAGILEVAAVGIDGVIHHVSQSVPNGGWTDWSPLGLQGGRLVGLSSGSTGDFHVIALNGIGSVVEKTFSGGSWSNWLQFSGTKRAVDGVCLADSVGLVRTFAIGLSNEVFDLTQWFVNGTPTWMPAVTVGDGFAWADGIAVGVNRDGRVEVFVRGNDGMLWHTGELAFRGAWSNWTLFGGPLETPRIVVARNGDDRLEVFFLGEKKVLMHAWQLAPDGVTGWSELTSREFTVEDFDVGTNLDGRLELFATTSDGEVFHTWQSF